MNMQHLAGQVAQNTQDISDMKTSARKQEVISMVSEIVTVLVAEAQGQVQPADHRRRQAGRTPGRAKDLA